MSGRNDYEIRYKAHQLQEAGIGFNDVLWTVRRSYFWLAKWLRRYREHGLAGLCDQSRAPKHVRNRTRKLLIRKILALRDELAAHKSRRAAFAGIGAETIHFELQRRGLRKVPAISTIEKILARAGKTKKVKVQRLAGGLLYPHIRTRTMGVLQQTDLVGPRYLRGSMALDSRPLLIFVSGCQRACKRIIAVLCRCIFPKREADLSSGMNSLLLKKMRLLRLCPSWLANMISRVEVSPIGYRIAKGAFWSVIGAAISRGLMLLSSIIAARILGKEVYGELGIVQSTVGMLGAFAGFGLGITATKHVAEYHKCDPERAGRIIGLSGLVAVVSGGLLALCLFIFAPWLAIHMINAPYLVKVLRIGSLILFLSAVTGAQMGALSGFEAFKSIAYINIAVGTLSFPLLIIGIYYGGVIGAVWALIITLVIQWLLNKIALKRKTQIFGVQISYKSLKSEFKVIWKFSVPALLTNSLNGPVNWVCSIMLVNSPNGYGEMGIYNMTRQWQIAVIFIPYWVGQVALPILSNLAGESKGLQYEKVFKKILLLNAGFALAICLPLIIFANMIASSYGPGFKEGASALRIQLLAAALIGANNIVGAAFASKGKMWIGFVLNALWASLLIITSWIYIQMGYGAFGLACATLIAYVLVIILQIVYLRGRQIL